LARNLEKLRRWIVPKATLNPGFLAVGIRPTTNVYVRAGRSID
jgi:hypothetical protein